MQLRRVIPLSIWLATILLMVAGLFAPGAASAHPGHAEARAPHPPAAVPAWPGPAPAGMLDHLAPDLDLPGEDGVAHPALAAPADRDPACAGAACCGTGHGCCAACPTGSADLPPPPAGGRPALLHAGAPPGLGAPRLPEPPRPFR